MMTNISSMGLYVTLIILLFDGILIEIDSAVSDKRGGVPYGLLKSNQFNWSKNKRYLRNDNENELLVSNICYNIKFVVMISNSLDLFIFK